MDQQAKWGLLGLLGFLGLSALVAVTVGKALKDPVERQEQPARPDLQVVRPDQSGPRAIRDPWVSQEVWGRQARPDLPDSREWPAPQGLPDLRDLPPRA